MTDFYWHGLMMALAWLVLIPTGTVIARFYKVRPRQDFPGHADDRFWWNSHRILQSVGAGLTVLAAWWAYKARGGEMDWLVLHAQLGLAVIGLCALQIAAPMFRGTKGGPTDTYADPKDPGTWGGDHYDMTLRRRIFEAWHKNLGYVVMAAGAVAIWTGIETAGLPDEWKWAFVVAALVFTAAFVRLTRLGRRIDTWIAIWGPDGGY